QLLRTDAFDRRDRTLQHVVAAAELARAFDGDDVARLFHDTDEVMVSALVEAEAAQVAPRDVEAATAPRDAVLRVLDRAREPLRAGRVDLQPIEGDALRRLRTDPRHPPELVDQRLHDPFVDVHGSSAPPGPPMPSPSPKPPSTEPRSMPPVAAPSFSAWSSRAMRIASTTPATTRSSGVSMSSGSTTLGSILIASSSPSPVTVARTTPPPTVASTLLFASSACAAAIDACIWAIISIGFGLVIIALLARAPARQSRRRSS